MRLDKHLKTKEVEMLALATINIISVDEKVENSQKSCSSAAREGGLVAFPVQSGAAGASRVVCSYARSPITIPIVLRHTAAHGTLHWGPDG